MSKVSVYNGIDVIDRYDHRFQGKNIGLITNPTGVDKKLQSTVDILNEKYGLKALFSPEHGVRGNVQAGSAVETYTDSKTSLPVYSLYGNTRKPTAEMLEGIDLMVFDIQDIGARYYTYIYTMAYAMEGCAKLGIPFVVLDRINPLGGVLLDGNVLDAKNSSFVGRYPIPVRHGLTVGELACLFNNEFGIYGTIDKNKTDLSEYTPYKVGSKNKIKLGKAYILCQGEDNTIGKYEIEIVKVSKNITSGSKGIVLTITDPKLLEQTGGIIQGMSGSPIIQNDMLVGAVTHVFVNDPKKGYGIFIECMLNEIEKYNNKSSATVQFAELSKAG